MGRKILVLAPHADDETLGMGASMAKWVRNGDSVTIAVLTGPGSEPHPLYPPATWDVVRAEAHRAFGVLGVKDVRFDNLPAVLVGDMPAWEVNKAVGDMIERVGPDELYVPFPFDMHRDHRELFHAASVAWRVSSPTGRSIRRVAAYEVMSETHWNAPYLEAGFLPHMFVDVTDTLSVKLDALHCFESQMRPAPHTRSIEACEALARFRGAQAGVAAAEAFVIIREFA